LEGIDCATRLTETTAAALKKAGIAAVGRYLGYKNLRLWKSITPEELKAIHGAGLGIFLIFETNPLKASYFNYAKGLSDAKAAADEAEYLGAPGETAVYFTVDYDAQPEDMPAIVEYVRGLKEVLAGQYLGGMYGSYRVLSALKASAYPPDRYYQTYAWSAGQNFGAHIYQYQNDISLQGVQVDRDTVQADAGLWFEEEEKYMDNLILYFGDGDRDIALNYADVLRCPVIRASFATPDLLKAAKNKFQVGGVSAPEGVTLLSDGANGDRFDTYAAVLKKLGKIK
jgi:hypothetical protein